MSLQAVINPLEFMKSGPAMVGKKVRKANEEFDMSKTIGERQHRSFPSAEEMERRIKERTTGGMTNMGGFDPSSLMSAPQLRQDATMNQANMVSSPYFEANEKAAEKTNPMNAASQEPGRSFLMKYIGK